MEWAFNREEDGVGVGSCSVAAPSASAATGGRRRCRHHRAERQAAQTEITPQEMQRCRPPSIPIEMSPKRINPSIHPSINPSIHP